MMANSNLDAMKVERTFINAEDVHEEVPAARAEALVPMPFRQFSEPPPRTQLKERASGVRVSSLDGNTTEDTRSTSEVSGSASDFQELAYCDPGAADQGWGRLTTMDHYNPHWGRLVTGDSLNWTRLVSGCGEEDGCQRVSALQDAGYAPMLAGAGLATSWLPFPNGMTQSLAAYPASGGSGSDDTAGLPRLSVSPKQLEKREEEERANSTPPPEWETTLTVMLRNLPNKYTQQMLLDEISTPEFKDKFDFFYLPIDRETGANKGYAFVNFIEPCYAWAFRQAYEGQKLTRFNSGKQVSVTPAALQGFEANHAHYSTARVSRADPSARPIFLREPNQATDTRESISSSRRRRRRGGGRSAIDQAARRLAAVQQEAARSAALPVGPQEVASSGEATPPSMPASPAAAMHVPEIQDVNISATPAMPAMTRAAGISGYPPMPLALDSHLQSKPAKQFCPFCGGKAQLNFNFCAVCGAYLDL